MPRIRREKRVLSCLDSNLLALHLAARSGTTSIVKVANIVISLINSFLLNMEQML